MFEQGKQNLFCAGKGCAQHSYNRLMNWVTWELRGEKYESCAEMEKHYPLILQLLMKKN